MSKVEEDFDPTQFSTLYNGSVLGRHVVEKGFQTGGFLALLIAVPLQAYKLHTATGSYAGLAVKALGAGSTWALWSTGITGTPAGAMGSVAGAARVSTYPDLKTSLEDRAYRLHHNKSQNRTDAFCRVGSVLGGAAAAATVHAPSAPLIFGGAALGAGVGVIAHLATSLPFAKKDT